MICWLGTGRPGESRCGGETGTRTRVMIRHVHLLSVWARCKPEMPTVLPGVKPSRQGLRDNAKPSFIKLLRDPEEPVVYRAQLSLRDTCSSGQPLAATTCPSGINKPARTQASGPAHHRHGNGRNRFRAPLDARRVQLVLAVGARKFAAMTTGRLVPLAPGSAIRA